MEAYRSRVIPDIQSMAFLGSGDSLVYRDTKKNTLMSCRIIEHVGSNAYMVDREVMINSMQTVMIVPE